MRCANAKVKRAGFLLLPAGQRGRSFMASWSPGGLSNAGEVFLRSSKLGNPVLDKRAKNTIVNKPGPFGSVPPESARATTCC